MNLPVNILHLDDSPADRALVRDTLEEMHGGFRVTGAASRQEFEARLADGAYDLVVSDFAMPDFDGLQVLEAVQARKPGLPVIFLTGTGSEEIGVEAMKRGAADYVIKSAQHLQRLPHAIQAALEHRRHCEERERAEATLLESEAKYRLLFDANPHPMWVFDLETLSFLAVNDRAIRHYGYSREEFLAMTLKDIRPPEEIPALLSNISDAPEKFGESGPWRHRKKDGAIIQVEITSHPITFEGRKAKIVLINDITDRLRVEARLLESSRFTQQIVESAAVGIVVYDRQLRYLLWNPFLEEAAGLPAREVLGKNALELFPFLREFGIDRLLERALAGETVTAPEVRYTVSQTGKSGWYSATYSPYRSAGGDIVGVVGMVQDITEQKLAQENILKEKALSESLVNSLPGVFYLFDQSGKFLMWNRNLERVSGYTTAEMAHLRPSDLVAPVNRAVVEQRIREVFERGESQAEADLLAKDGRQTPYFFTGVRVPVDGRPCVIGMGLDMAERKRAEASLRQSEERFSKAFRGSPIGIAISTVAEGRFIDVNEALLQTFGYRREEVIGRTALELNLWASPDDRSRMIQSLQQQGSLTNLELRFRRKSEELGVALFSAERMELGGEQCLLALILDITEKKKLETQFLRAQRMESIGTLASGIAHDLNNILTPILMSIQMLRLGLRPEQADETLAIIESSAKRGASVVKQLMTFGRGAGGEKVVVQPRHLIDDMVRIAGQTFPKNVTINPKVAVDLWTVIGDPTQIHQVVLNLAVNARDAMPEGGLLTIRAENLLLDEQYAGMNREARPGPYVLIEVTDTGQGIPAEIMDKIFDPFFTTKEVGKGTGLGLSTVHGIVKSHGGFVMAQSEPGKGSRFEVYLPATPEAPAATGALASPPLPHGHGELILVVDDEAGICDLTRRILKKHGYEVLTCEDGTEALSLFAQHRDAVKAVLTDIMMPFMDGVALSRALKKMHPQVRIIASSGMGEGQSQNQKLAQLKGLGVKSFLAKPYTTDKLLHLLQEVLQEDKPV